ncbi:MAG: hypothetical protein FWC30_01865 [Candidatus Bathyarchaeota archaeon]|nr:hypothetical protein [Candidatus Termiticorpusculum sp.]
MRKTVFLLLLVFGVSFLSVSELVLAQDQIKPEVPEFTLKLVDDSGYLFPGPAQNMNPETGTYTVEGKNDIFQATYIDNWLLNIAIKNQYDVIIYDIRFKTDFEQEWTEQFSYSSSILPSRPESEKQYTLTKINVNSYSDGTRVEVQVEALSGTISPRGKDDDPGIPIDQHNSFYGVGSGWSESKKLIIDRKGNGSSDRPFIDTSFSWLEFGLLTLVVVSIIVVVATLFILKKVINKKCLQQQTTTQQTQNNPTKNHNNTYQLN